MFDAFDEICMRRALRLAQRGAGHVEPNPMVGCVIARKARIVAEGWHRRFGGPHAEIEALKRCGGRARGTTAYVTLEPCCYYGKTPPCVDALVSAGVGRVVAAIVDPNPRVSGRGLRRLREAGVRVEAGLLADEAAELISPFAKLMRTQRPWVILKWAQSIDGCVATRTNDAKWISDERMRAHAHRIRGRIDAIVAGLGTVLSDDPLLTCRVGVPRRIATRVVLDSRLRIPLEARVVRTARRFPTLIFHAPTAPARRRAELEEMGCELHPVPGMRTGLSLPAVLEELGKRDFTNVLVEGGPTLVGAFADEHLADEVQVYLAPSLIGGAHARHALEGTGPAKLRDALRFTSTPTMTRVGDGWFLNARLTRSVRREFL